MAKYINTVESEHIWQHMRSSVTSQYCSQSLEITYQCADLKVLTDALARIIRECTDEGDAEVTGCNMDLYRAILSEPSSNFD